MASVSVRLFFRILAIALAFAPSRSFACSPMSNTLAKFEAHNLGEAIIAPDAPLVSVQSIRRGGDRQDSCSDIGRIILLITPGQAAYAYRFEVITGNSPSGSFIDKPVVGYDSNGKHAFQFIWLEPGKAVPLDFKVRVTAYSKSGNKGGFTTIHILDDGRQ
ncbi:MAG: hypothetical protein ACREPB_06850 [Arenimonas sp.]